MKPWALSVLLFIAQPLFAGSGSPGPTPSDELCAKFFTKPIDLTKEDLQLIEKSKRGPILSGGAYPNQENIELDSRISATKLVNKWNLYLVREDGAPCYDSPSDTVKNSKAQLDEISRKRMELFDVRIHDATEIFLICGKVQYDFPSFVTNENELEFAFETKAGNSAFIAHWNAISFKSGKNISHFKFKGENSIIFLSDGNGLLASNWGDPFAAAHEIAHSNLSMPNVARAFRYLDEGFADFKAFWSTGKKFFNGGEERRDISNPDGKTLQSFFSDYSPSADNYQLGSMVAFHLYKHWQKLLEYKTPQAAQYMIHYMRRLAQLLSHESPDVVKQNGQRSFRVHKSYNYEKAHRILSFLASASMQWSMEEKRPIELTEWLCFHWTEVMGVRGPFQRHRIQDVDSDGNFYLGESEEMNYGKVKVPDQWKTCDELSSLLRTQMN